MMMRSQDLPPAEPAMQFIGDLLVVAMLDERRCSDDVLHLDHSADGFNAQAVDDGLPVVGAGGKELSAVDVQLPPSFPC